MGLQFSRVWERMFGKKEMRILMVGLDAAGKVRFFLSNTRIDLTLTYLYNTIADVLNRPLFYISSNLERLSQLFLLLVSCYK